MGKLLTIAISLHMEMSRLFHSTHTRLQRVMDIEIRNLPYILDHSIENSKESTLDRLLTFLTSRRASASRNSSGGSAPSRPAAPCPIPLTSAPEQATERDPRRAGPEEVST